MKKYIPHAIILTMAVVLFFSIERCTYNGRALSQNTIALADTVTYFNNALGTQTASVKTLSVDNRQLRDLVTARNSQLATMAAGFAGVHTVVKYKSEVKVDTVYVAFEAKDTLPAFEHKGAVFDEWYSFNYNVNNNGLALSNLSLQTETGIITGVKRKWFLGKETLVTDVSNTNPYITVTQLSAAEVSLPVPWYKKWYVWLGAGVIGGFALAH